MSSIHLHSRSTTLLRFSDQSPGLASVHQPPVRQGSQPREPTGDNEILHLYCGGTSHFQLVKIHLMQTRVFVQIRVLHAYKYTRYWCDEAAYSPPAPCLPPFKHTCPPPTTMWSVGTRKEPRRCWRGSKGEVGCRRSHQGMRHSSAWLSDYMARCHIIVIMARLVQEK